MRHHVTHPLFDVATFLYGSLAAVFSGIAVIYLIYCLFSRDDLYRGQRLGASLVTSGQLIVFAYWQLRLHPMLHSGVLSPSSLFAGAALTFIGLIAMAQKQSNRTWLWF